ncbi:S49 family peptidase [Rhizobium leguminosarum]|uniref:S49 family peptidase n=1 Tax=Rhizobium leguminosarum TaxID=384 RepID=UPI0021BC1202|nr:S49 family peptidase [Rhizobium leguminosarum]
MPDRLQAIAEVIERRVEGFRLSREEIAALKGERQPNGVATYFSLDTRSGLITPQAAANGPTSNGGTVIAVISVFGIIAQHAPQVDDISGPGGTSTERLSDSLKKAVADPSVSSVVLNIDSPGGSVHGVQALAAEIYKAREQKPIIAQVNSLAASAAYWIASSASEIVVTPGGLVGSIGVYTLHQDVSKAVDRAGLKFTFISAGKYKVEGNAFQPLSDDASKASQGRVDSYYRDFTGDVARGRKVPVDQVRSGFGEGRVVKDHDAVKAKMADRVGTLDSTIKGLMTRKPNQGSRPAGAHAAGANAVDADAFRRRRHALRSLGG